ncbi:helix-turn-helix domain-containing protein [Rubrobacter tropicus]|uniref:Helix-turn-helix domain-containing protein n=1 Tax=Rubrobacter tropicus TaxID=2653851 RepID=A0A6G8QAM0_9ACTN|nr:helix-turn-helix domain-containing protein [Rubrobacter tropicus]QIN83483.1 helix-turn-helix domain-containing protein [Rubrobacter tropicus]
MNSDTEPAPGPYPPPGVLVAGHFREEFGYRVRRPGGSGNWLLTYTLGGRGLFRQPGASLSAGPGDVVLLEPGAAQDYSVPEGNHWEFVWAHFQPRMGWSEWLRLPAAGEGLYLSRLEDPRSRGRVRGAFFGLLADALPGRGLQEELALNGLEEVLLVAVREADSAGERGMDGRVRRVLALISADPASRHDVPSLARAVALSPSRLAHLFKEETGGSVMGTVLALRLRQAARLLEHTAGSVKDVSEQTGFESPYYFSRRFRQHYGVSPRQYRQQRV